MGGRQQTTGQAWEPFAVPDLAALLDGLHVVSIPMRVPFRGLSHREVALICGPAGWGEFGAFPEYPPAQAARWLAAAIEAAYAGWPAPVRDEVPVNATVPAVPAHRVPEVLARFDGCTTAKVKVAEPGQGLADDVPRVAAVRDVLGPQGRIRVDANGGWDLPQATRALGALAAYGIEYAEQPCPDVPDLRALRIALARRGIDVPVAADESIRHAADPARVARAEAADLIVVKVAPLGGVVRALAIVAECGLPAVVSSALDTSIGIAGGLALAAALPQLPYACGLGTVRLLAGDVTTDSLVARAGAVALRSVDVDQGLVRRWAAAPDRVRWWQARLAACLAELSAPDG